MDMLVRIFKRALCERVSFAINSLNGDALPMVKTEGYPAFLHEALNGEKFE
jgi:hypothetical protein